jgi:mandelate racemase
LPAWWSERSIWALWDALARAMDVPLAVLLGGEIRPLPAYDSFGTLDPRTDLTWLEESVTRGFKAIKIKLGAGDVESDLAIVADVRKTIGNGVRLMLDFNQSQSTEMFACRINSCSTFTSSSFPLRSVAYVCRNVCQPK